VRLADPYSRADEAAVWFADQFAQLKKDFIDGTGVARQLGVLGNVELEKKVADLIRQMIKPGSGGGETKARKTGFFGRFFNR
jgi:hypothetical protein